MKNINTLVMVLSLLTVTGLFAYGATGYQATHEGAVGYQGNGGVGYHAGEGAVGYQAGDYTDEPINYQAGDGVIMPEDDVPHGFHRIEGAGLEELQ